MRDARIGRMVHKVLVSWLVLALLAPRLSADESSRVLQAAQTPVTQVGHPYKWPGLIMIGIGGLVSVAAALGAAGVEGVSFRQCQADAAQRGANDNCRGALGTNPSLAALGLGLMAGGTLIALQRPARTPQITIGPGRVFVSGGVSF
jgi:hypothetical protein